MLVASTVPRSIYYDKFQLVSVQESMSTSELLIPHLDIFPFFVLAVSRVACVIKSYCWCVILTHDPCESVETKSCGYPSPLKVCSWSHVD